ncbi:hypothetical protein FB451DRAFT_1245808 [Mycena latifolia]|nr:hypothetical protein FB451DRAFT_1245808 [Mycena latifolia]
MLYLSTASPLLVPAMKYGLFCCTILLVAGTSARRLWLSAAVLHHLSPYQMISHPTPDARLRRPTSHVPLSLCRSYCP